MQNNVKDRTDQLINYSHTTTYNKDQVIVLQSYKKKTQNLNKYCWWKIHKQNPNFRFIFKIIQHELLVFVRTILQSSLNS